MRRRSTHPPRRLPFQSEDHSQTGAATAGRPQIPGRTKPSSQPQLAATPRRYSGASSYLYLQYKVLFIMSTILRADGKNDHDVERVHPECKAGYAESRRQILS